MDDFFKNKLEDFAEDSDGWDRPGFDAWARARGQVPATATGQRLRWIGIGLGILLLLLLLGYNLYLQRTVNDLLDSVAQTEAELTERTLAAEKWRAAATQWSAAIPKLPSPALTISPITTPPKIIIRQLYTPNALVRELRDSLQLLRQQLQQTTPPIAQQERKNVIAPLATPVNQLHVARLSDSLPTLSPPEYVFSGLGKKAVPKQWKRFEVGTKFSILPYRIPISSNVANVESIQGESEDLEGYDGLFGLQAGYALQPNLYLQTGIRRSNLEIEKSVISGIIYDKSGEYTQTNGTLANDILLQNRTSFSDVAQTITVEIPVGTQLETGDLLLLTQTNYQVINFSQVPLGLSYLLGKKRWQLQYLGGLIWNRVGISNYDIRANFQANNIEIPVDDIRIVSDTEMVSHFLTAYVGVGVNYQLSPNWQLRTNLTVEDNTHDFDSNNFLRFNDVGVGWNGSLNYRF